MNKDISLKQIKDVYKERKDYQALISNKPLEAKKFLPTSPNLRGEAQLTSHSVNVNTLSDRDRVIVPSKRGKAAKAEKL